MQSENIGANNYLFLSGNIFIHRRFLNKRVGIWFTVYKLHKFCYDNLLPREEVIHKQKQSGIY